jgi:hypothetical protein
VNVASHCCVRPFALKARKSGRTGIRGGPKDAIDQFLRQKKPDNATVVKANWRDNPWFPQVLEDERQLDLKLYPERYEHIWEGDFARAFEGAYFAQRLNVAKQQGRIARREHGRPGVSDPGFALL